ncbi:MAG: flagellar FliJ family protein [Oscillospiraceae bacterium]|jgi:flagellar FliJ protein|nr:flagellar FliJ family protein [Oscillospiraceae bacterium]
MKKFTFSLARLKKYREQMLESEKNRLGELRSQLNALNRELEAILAQVERENDGIRLLFTGGTSQPNEIGLRKRFVTSLQAKAEEQRIKIIGKEREVEVQLNVVIEATKDTETLSKLEEHQLEEYRKDELKENELFIEEFVSNRIISNS